MTEIVNAILECVKYSGPTPRLALYETLVEFRTRYPRSWKSLIHPPWAQVLIFGLLKDLGDDEE